MAILHSADIRVTIISRIWAYATAMIALSLLFSGRERDWKITLLPATIAMSAAISTVVIWGKSHPHRRSTLHVTENLEELKQRIEDLEAITAGSTDFLDKTLSSNASAAITCD
jgi:hypothetical protein